MSKCRTLPGHTGNITAVQLSMGFSINYVLMLSNLVFQMLLNHTQLKQPHLNGHDVPARERTPYRTGFAKRISIRALPQDSGWTSAICEANMASSGTAESFLTASSITRATQGHTRSQHAVYTI